MTDIPWWYGARIGLWHIDTDEAPGIPLCGAEIISSGASACYRTAENEAPPKRFGFVVADICTACALIHGGCTQTGTLVATRPHRITGEPMVWIKQSGGEVWLTREQVRLALKTLMAFAETGKVEEGETL